HAFDELLDQPDLERTDEANLDQPVFEQGRAEHAHGAPDEKGGDDPPRRKGWTRIVIQVPDDRGNRHQKAAEEDDRGKQNDVVGRATDGDGRAPEQEANHEDRPPGWSPALSGFFCLDPHLVPSLPRRGGRLQPARLAGVNRKMSHRAAAAGPVPMLLAWPGCDRVANPDL